ncbi:MAG: FAD-dependent oxidoreductase [Saccharolobus sp.]|uniref:2,4-dienoyl-CoA reductase [NADPH] n=1 Tax=Saccharolobus shibatae TaxID=2286 RepID=A0A8F5BW37_9CREN|nr:FAD-dependent oxidoreductase [Saccharolobus shibatae]MCH4814668.1 FAD-dependent oxidoreductase [Saccharolobus shibatae]QXJ32526.1 2,4-dienoyl-CoA reductase [NADPH] [Saccharolobus shibatae]QXJ35687.1 2,4-dienoyl-CoA reductase [NADPH] [Saccharolobus shibatae]
MDLSKLLEPIRIGDVVLKNRIAMSPMISNLGTPEGYPSDTHIAYLAERAKGGVGLIITEYTYVNHVDARGSVNELGMYSDELTPKFMRLTELIHALGSKIFVQLVHVGRKTRKDIIWGNKPIAPSPIPIMDEVREMTKEDIERVKNDFINAAMRAKRAGFDGIELHGAHGYLLAQFLSPATNKRNDEYKDGVRFVEEILKGIKEKIKITVGIRISVTEFDNEGLTPEMVAEIGKRLEKAGIDYIHLSAGRDGPLGSSMPYYYKRLAFLEEAKVVRDAVNVPLFLVGSMITPEDAIKAREIADVVVLGRQLLADPYWLEKAKRDLPIRPCIRCNQSCRGVVYKEVRCDVNPELGWELLPPLEKGKGEVIVVGGGVMGLEAARVLALRGFTVTLYEQNNRLGGQFLLYKDPWKVKEFLELISYYEKELKRLNVEVKLNAKMECSDCIMAIPDYEIPKMPDVKGEKVLIDSNLYVYHDYAFELAKYNEVFMTERSFKGLDRTREYLLRKELSEVGVKFLEERNSMRFDVEIHNVVDDQPSIGKSIQRGYWLGRTFKSY